MFRIALPSNASLDYFPDNTPSMYTTKPAVAFNLDEDYEVALSEIIYPNSWYNVRDKFNTIEVYDKKKKLETVYIKPGYYSSMDRLFTAIKKNIIKIVEPYHEKDKTVFIGDYTGNAEFIKMAYNEFNQKVYIKSHIKYNLVFQGDIARLLGFSNNSQMIVDDHYSEQSRYKVMESEFPAFLTGRYNAMYIYTDIIQDQYVGGQTVPLLRIVDLDQHRNTDYTSKTFDNEYFAPLKKSQFDTIDIKICDDTGEKIVFNNGKIVIILTFRTKAI